ncbi:tol-pal system-associated acyl-CoA thioesterase [Aestuariirhabdus litorea]|uniref:Tol-pal system-associated acyl-CoA thioesterase n=1 Tax=Aestuariirhabdus litorea TaxID=2528527 RepID=A0A3P3VN96_9GAMM|nr:tol-pal system-associated acyl-CoA thioesterase [Aestuariirhabdus litorea]RRJ84175.1 tol-pal system-associated acyl-CoA thioesterase [Aestuariirhabdus litorea]RWW97395.1 tol-pal system-associated acyl-CoA thioesterase [Endozoicomonadaceae bacterium GTF-13]
MSAGCEKPFVTHCRVYFEDTDAGGIVYYVNYLKFMERARTEYLRSLGYEQQRLFDEQLMFVVHSLNAGYRRPARLDDLLRLELVVSRAAKSYLLFQQRVLKDESGELLCEAQVKVACVRCEDMKPRVIPERMRAAMVAGTSAP